MVEILNIISSILAFTSIGLAFIIFFVEKFIQIVKLNKIKEKNFEDILESSNIKLLGNYLDSEVGKMTISDYVDNKKINKKN